MGRLRDALMQIGVFLVTLVQLALAGILIGYVYFPILAIVGLLNVLKVIITGESFENTDTLTEPLWWYWHQVMVLFAIKDDFRAAPYLD